MKAIYFPPISGHSFCLQSLLPSDIAKKPTPAPPAVPEGCQVQGASVCPELYVSRRGECCSGGAQLISGCG